MTPPTKRVQHDSPPRPSRYQGAGILPEEKTVLGIAKKVWRSRPTEVQNLSIPPWYSGLFGLPNWYLRQKVDHPKMDDHKRGMCLLVRMNYILDFHHKFKDMVDRSSFFCLPARRFRFFCRSLGPVYEDGAYRNLNYGQHMNTSYALSAIYNWKRALNSTVGNFVHLLSYCRNSLRYTQAHVPQSGVPVADSVSLLAADDSFYFQ